MIKVVAVGFTSRHATSLGSWWVLMGTPVGIPMGMSQGLIRGSMSLLPTDLGSGCQNCGYPHGYPWIFA